MPRASGPAAKALVLNEALVKLAEVERRGFRQSHAELTSKGAIGCALSHMCIWLDILCDSTAQPGQLYLVMEDDAVLPKRLLALLKRSLQGVPADWDILLLG